MDAVFYDKDWSMKRYLKENMPAPDFELLDTQDRPVKLSDYLHKKLVVLVFNRGFV